MKNIKVTIIVCVIFTLLFGSVKIFGEISNDLKTSDEKIAPMDTIKEPISTAEISDDSIAYLEWVKTYAPTKEMQKTIARLIASGADVDALISVCIFWEDTDKPFSIVEEIYSLAPEDIADYSDHIIWIESTYNNLCNIEDEALTIDEVKAYVKDGIPTYDILIANRMSRKDGNDIKDILEERKNGKSWYDLIISEDAPALSDYENIGGNNLLDIKILSENTGQSINDLLLKSAEMEDGELIYSIRSANRTEAKKELLSLSGENTDTLN